MRLEHYPTEKLEEEVLKVLTKHINLGSYKVFFFGSRVEGKGDARSDIDIGLEGPGPVPARAWAEIQEEIENLSTLYKVEIVDFKKVPPDFREVALRHVRPIETQHRDRHGS